MFEEDTTKVADEVVEDVSEETPAEEKPEEPKEETVEETPEPEIQLPPPRKVTAQERINEITRKRREAEREVARLKKQLEEKQAQPQSSNRPRLENFETQEAYEDAVADWKYDQREAVRKEERALQEFKKKAAEFKKEYEDFDEVVEQPVYSRVMQEVIFKSDNGVMLAYYLGRPENREVADRINELSEIDQVYEMGKLEAKLLLAKKIKKTTTAPEPIKPVGTKGSAVVDDSNLSDDEWFKREQQREMEKAKKKLGY